MGAVERLRPAGTLADSYLTGAWAGSGMTAGPGIEAPGGDDRVPGVQHFGAEAPTPINPAELTPVQREGLGRPQTHRITMGFAGEHDGYQDAPALDGRHQDVRGRPAVVGVIGVRQLPWLGTPRTLFREAPPTDANNPAPGGCS